MPFWLTVKPYRIITSSRVFVSLFVPLKAFQFLLLVSVSVQHLSLFTLQSLFSTLFLLSLSDGKNIVNVWGFFSILFLFIYMVYDFFKMNFSVVLIKVFFFQRDKPVHPGLRFLLFCCHYNTPCYVSDHR